MIKRFTLLHPESPGFNTKEEVNIRLESTGIPQSKGCGVTGFTLFEILISFLVLLIVIAGIYSALSMGNNTYNEDTGLLDLQQSARQATEIMTKELRQAVVTSLSSNTVTFDNLSDLGIQYYRNGTTNQVIREYPTGTLRVLANYANNLSFCWCHDDGSCTTSRNCSDTCSDSYLLQITLGVTKTVKQRVLSFSLIEKVKLRNE